ncbi:unnamed protein product, partial [Choristocarpus tenellus]
ALSNTPPSADSGGCLICGNNDEHHFMLLCDGCDGEFHTRCLKPRLDRIPEGDWFCDACVVTRENKEDRRLGSGSSGAAR